MKQTLSRITAAAFAAVLAALSLGTPPEPAGLVFAEDFVSAKFSFTRISVFSPDIPGDWTAEPYTTPNYYAVKSAGELERIIGDYVTPEKCAELTADYSDAFFADNLLVLHIGLEPYLGQITDYKFGGARLEDGMLQIDTSMNVSASICKTYYLDLMQTVIPKSEYNDQPVLWNQTEVLEENLVRMTLCDADTGKKLPWSETLFPVTVSAQFADAKDVPEIPLHGNPSFWSAEKYAAAGECTWSLGGLPEDYTLLPERTACTRYDNGAMDVTFYVRQPVSLKGKVRITLLDADTGQPILLTGSTDAELWTDIRYRADDQPGGWISTGPVYLLDANPALVDGLLGFFDADYFAFGLADYANTLPKGYVLPETDTAVPGYYNGASVPEGYITITRTEDYADAVIRLQFQPDGDISGDGAFGAADLVTLQKWLLGGAKTAPESWKAADLDNDNLLTAVDLTLLKRRILAQ